MRQILCAFLNVYLVIMFARVILSWVPLRPGTGLANIMHVLMQLTEPVVAPVRRIVPPAGMFDLSFMVVFIAILLIHGVFVCPGAFL